MNSRFILLDKGQVAFCDIDTKTDTKFVVDKAISVGYSILIVCYAFTNW